MKLPSSLILLVLIVFTSCVPGRRFQEVQTEARVCAQERDALRLNNEELKADLDDCLTGNETMKREYVRLKEDTSLLGTSLRRMTVQYDKINELNEQLMDKQASLMSSRESEKRELLENLLSLQNDLQSQQQNLFTLETELNDKTRELEEREARVQELESLLGKQEEAVQSIKQRVTNALLGVKDKGISIIEKDGRVYISLDAKLLFASGSTAVSSEGTDALIELAKAIQDEEDLKIMVEGHTDSDKIVSTSLPYKDNWDLSVMRATSVVRIMMDNSRIDPKQLTASGRGEHLPVDPDDKAKNRRIEIILVPNLTELFEFINEQ